MTQWQPCPGPGDAEGLYAVLDIATDAPVGEIRRAHRREVTTWHPDRCVDPVAEARIRHINRARDVLADPDSRETYDRSSADWFDVEPGLTIVDFSSVKLGQRKVLRIPVRVTGDHPRVHEIDIPRISGAWWNLDVLPSRETPGSALLFELEITVVALQAGDHDDQLIFFVAGRPILIPMRCTVERPTVATRVSNRVKHWTSSSITRWKAAPVRVWSSNTHRWLSIGFVGLLPALWYANNRINNSFATGAIDENRLQIGQISIFVVLAIALVAAVATKWLRVGSWKSGIVAGTLAVPGLIAAAWVALLVIALALALAVAFLILALIGMILGGD